MILIANPFPIQSQYHFAHQTPTALPASHGGMAWTELLVEHFRMTAQSKGRTTIKSLWFATVLVLCSGLAAQTTSQPSEQPKTAPQTQAILSSYEGQNVTAVEIAGRPSLDTSKLLPLLPQHSGEPFSKEKVDESIDALKKAGKLRPGATAGRTRGERSPSAVDRRARSLVWHLRVSRRREVQLLSPGANRELSSAGPFQRRRRPKRHRCFAEFFPAARLLRSRSAPPGKPGH